MGSALLEKDRSLLCWPGLELCPLFPTLCSVNFLIINLSLTDGFLMRWLGLLYPVFPNL